MRISDWSSDVCSSDLFEHVINEIAAVIGLQTGRRSFQRTNGEPMQRITTERTACLIAEHARTAAQHGTFARSRAMRIVHGFEIHPRRALLPGLRQTVDIEPLDTVEPWREQGTWRQLGTRFGCRMAEHHAAAAPPPTVQLRLGIRSEEH